MKFINFLLIIFISLPSVIKAELNEDLARQLTEGGKVIFIRHAYAPGSGDPDNFDISNCATQRNLNNKGKIQARKITDFFISHKIPVHKVISSEWCRCKETALIAFEKFETKTFLNSFYSINFSNNRNQQIKDLKEYLDQCHSKKNLILITHYVVISEVLEYNPSSGEIVVADKNFKKLGSIKIDY